MEEDIKLLNDYLEESDRKFVPPKRFKFLQAIKNLINKYKEQEKIIKLMAKDMEKMTGSCPFDLYDVETSEGCDNICQTLADNKQQYKCFIEYYEKKAKGE